LGGCSSLKTSIDIQAPSERVWSIVADVEHYHCWNPFFVRAAGALREGESLRLTMQPVGKDAQSFAPKVLEVTSGRRFVWRGRLFMPGLFDGKHVFTIERLDPSRTRFTQEESFSGVLVPFAGLGPYREGWERMNHALKARAEGRPASASK
jgi:hypothetical protein